MHLNLSRGRYKCLSLALSLSPLSLSLSLTYVYGTAMQVAKGERMPPAGQQRPSVGGVEYGTGTAVATHPRARTFRKGRTSSWTIFLVALQVRRVALCACTSICQIV